MTTPDLPQTLDYLPEEKLALLRRTIGARLRLLATAKTPEKKRFERLEQETGIPSATWRTWWRREATPSGQIIEATAKAWPEHAFWLVTGITDVEAGHTMPTPPSIVRAYIDPFPETPFSAKSHYDSNKATSWASTSEEPGGVLLGDTKFGKWPDGAKEFLEYTEQYLRYTLELQTLYWQHYGNSDKEEKAKREVLNAARLKARQERWKHQLNKNELKK